MMVYKHLSVRTAVASVAVFASAVGGTTQAAELGFYVAGFYGNAEKASVSLQAFDDLALRVYAGGIYGGDSFVPAQSTSSLGDGKDSSFGIMSGYRLTSWLAVEGGYIDLGELSYRNESFGTHFIPGGSHDEPWEQHLTATTTGIALSALGVLPLSYRWEVYARAGVLFATNKLELFLTDFQSNVGGSVSESSTDMLAGAGISFSFAEVYNARLEFMRVFDAGEGLAESDVDVLSIGFAVTF